MSILLDTHVAIWSVTARHKLPADALVLIESAFAVFVSAASLWEIAIRHGLRRQDAPPFGAATALREFQDAGFALLSIDPAHVLAAETLPALHGDPFDRLIIAQAGTAGVRLVTRDKAVARYDRSMMLI